MAARINRLVVRTVLVCAALAGLAAMQNHHDHPCHADQVGAIGMCAPARIGGSL